MKCANCKFWNKDKSISRDSGYFSPSLGGSGYCNRVGGGGAKMDIEATAADDTDLFAGLITNEDFGCTEWVKDEH